MQTELLIGLLMCHWFCDYVIPTNRMLSAKKNGKPIIPILEHALTHGLVMGVFIWIYISSATGVWIGITGMEMKLFLFQVISHFIIDFSKGRLCYYCPGLRNIDNRWYWFVFGLDQTLHVFVILGMVNYLTK